MTNLTKIAILRTRLLDRRNRTEDGELYVLLDDTLAALRSVQRILWEVKKVVGPVRAIESEVLTK